MLQHPLGLLTRIIFNPIKRQTVIRRKHHILEQIRRTKMSQSFISPRQTIEQRYTFKRCRCNFSRLIHWYAIVILPVQVLLLNSIFFSTTGRIVWFLRGKFLGQWTEESVVCWFCWNFGTSTARFWGSAAEGFELVEDQMKNIIRKRRQRNSFALHIFFFQEAIKKTENFELQNFSNQSFFFLSFFVISLYCKRPKSGEAGCRLNSPCKIYSQPQNIPRWGCTNSKEYISSESRPRYFDPTAFLYVYARDSHTNVIWT